MVQVRKMLQLPCCLAVFPFFVVSVSIGIHDDVSHLINHLSQSSFGFQQYGKGRLP